MTLVDASSFIDPSAEDLPSPRLAEQTQPPPYAASPFPTRSLFNHGGLTCHPVTESEMSEEAETTIVVHHLQTDSVNTDCDLLFDMTGGMVSSPQWMGFSGEEPLYLTPDMGMGGGMMMSTSPPRMNYFSPPSGDSDPFRLWNFADHSEAQESENRKGMMMQPNWKQQQQPCIEEVDVGSGLGQNQSLGICAASLEEENYKGGTVQQSCWASFDPLDNGAYSVVHELHIRERIMKITVSWNALNFELCSHKEFWLNIDVQAMEKGLPVAHTDVNLFWECKCITFILIVPIKSWELIHGGSDCWIIGLAILPTVCYHLYGAQLEMASLELLHLNNLKKLLLDNLVNRPEIEKSHTVHILPALPLHEAEEYKMTMQLDLPCELHIPKSSATNNAIGNSLKNYAVCSLQALDAQDDFCIATGYLESSATNEERNNSIDPKGGNSNSQKTDTVSRWEKDHGITLHLLQQMFGKSRDAAAKTLEDHSEVQELENRKGMMMQPTWKQQQQQQCLMCIKLGAARVSTTVADLTALDSLICLSYCQPGLPGPLGVTPCLLSLECLCQNMVIELGNGEHIMRLNVMPKQAYLEVDFSSEKTNAICSWQALELESWGGMIMERISVSHRWRYAFCSKTHPWNVVLEVLDVVVSLLLCLGTNNYSFGISVNDDRPFSSSSVNSKMHSLLYFERTFLEMQHLNSLERQFVDHFERLVQTGLLELLSGEEIKLRYLQQEEEVGTASQKNHSVSILPALLEAECKMMQLDSPCEAHIPKSNATNEETNVVVGLKRTDAIGRNSWKKKDFIWWQKDHGISRKVLEPLFGKRSRDALKVSPSTFKRARRDFGITRCSLEEVGTASEKNHTADICPALEAQYNAAGREGMLLLQQEDSSSEAHIPESSATNEERNNVVVVELNNSIDANGGNSNSEKTDTISRWEKDYGITHQVLEQLFGKSRDDAAKTLKVSISTFKRACRDFGINRWPNYKGKRPNCSLNQKQHVQAVKKHKGIQPACPALPPLQATDTSC